MKLSSVYSYIFTLVLIGSLLVYEKYVEDDPLDIPITYTQLGPLNGWTVMHFLVFMMMGYLFPEALFQSTLWGLVWEVLYTTEMAKKYFKTSARITQFTLWWRGEILDVIANLLGYMCGVMLRYHQSGQLGTLFKIDLL